MSESGSYSETCSEDCSDYTQSNSCRSSNKSSGESRHRRVPQNYNNNLQPGIYTSLPPGAVQIPDFSMGYQQYQQCQPTTPAQSGLALTVPLNPVSNLQGHWSQSDNAIKVFVQRRGGVVTMQWETFSGLIGGRGLKYIVMNISFKGMPIAPIVETIAVEYRGVMRTGYLRIDPHIKDVIQFHYDLSDTILSEVGDKIVVHGKAVSWIANDSIRQY